MRISLVLLTHPPSEPLLRQCLGSLEAAGAAAGGWEVLVGYNGAGPAQDQALARLRRSYPWACWVPLPRSSRGRARNRVAELAGGDVLHFLDDDTVVPPDFLSRLRAAYAAHPEAPALGGPNVGPTGAASFQRSVDFLLRSPFGAGPMRARYLRKGRARTRPGWCFMLSNVGLRRDVMARHGIRFPEDCDSAEENLLLFEVERRLRRAVFDPELFVYHHRRTGWRAFCRQVACNGRGRAQITRAAPESLNPVVLAPAAAVAAAAALALAGRWAVLGLLAGLYAAPALAEALRLAIVERDPAAAWRLPGLFAAAHLSYALGFVGGLLSPKTAGAPAAWDWAEAHAAADA